MILPADLQPRPVWASGMMRLATGFTGGVTVRNPANGNTLDLAYGADGKIDAAALDAFRAGQIFQLFERADQIGAIANAKAVGTFTRAPKIGALNLGGHRCMWMEGDSQTANPAPTGQVYGMETSADLTSLNIRAGSHTVIQVVQQHNAIYDNQLFGLHRGVTFSMTDAGGNPVARIYNDGLGDGTTRGASYTVTDGTPYLYRANDCVVETCPTILTYITGPSGTFVGQNEDVRSIATRSAKTSVASKLRIGFHEGSDVPPAPANGTSEAGGFAEILTMVWNVPLTLGQAAQVRSLLYDLVPIDPRRSRWTAPLVITMTDSVWAGYKGDDLRCWDKRAAANLPSYVRWANYAVPGSPILPQSTIVPVYGYTLGTFPNWIAQAVKMHKGRVHCVWGCPINDFLISPQPTVAQAYNNGTLGLINLVRAVDPAAKFTICTSTGNNNPPMQTWQHQVDTLIRNGAAANNYTVVDFAADAFLNDPPIPGPANKDGTHLTNEGFDREAVLITPVIRSWLTSLGLP